MHSVKNGTSKSFLFNTISYFFFFLSSFSYCCYSLDKMRSLQEKYTRKNIAGNIRQAKGLEIKFNLHYYIIHYSTHFNSQSSLLSYPQQQLENYCPFCLIKFQNIKTLLNALDCRTSTTTTTNFYVFCFYFFIIFHFMFCFNERKSTTNKKLYV